MRSRILVTLLCVLAPATTRAAIRPSFEEGSSTWHATHIVVVDRDGRVLESWKGDLKAAQRIDLGPLKIPATPAVSKFPFGRPAVQVMSDARRILFLRHEGKDWKPAANWGGMEVSLVWVEQGQLFAFRQMMNPGPTELFPQEGTEGALKDRVVKAARVQEEFNRAAGDPDPTKRARAVLPFLDMRKTYGPYGESLKVLSGCGSTALPVLRPLLEDEGQLRLHIDIIGVIGKAAGPEATADLEKVLEQELVYWKNNAPALGMWWGQEPMTTHYGRVIAVLRQMKAIGYQDGRGLVAKLRDFWAATPQLDYVGKGTGPDGKLVGKSQVVEEAEAVLKK
jgi:hypothetical protein